MTTLAKQDAWTPHTPARLVVADPPAPFPFLAVALGVVGGLALACVLIVLVLRAREWLYRKHAESWAARRAAAALGLTRAEAALATKMAQAGGSPTAAVLVSGEVLRVCAQALCDRGVSAAEKARVAAMCERYGVRAPEVRQESKTAATSAQTKAQPKRTPVPPPRKTPSPGVASAPRTQRKAG